MFKEFIVERTAENGGNKLYQSYEEVVADYQENLVNSLHPADLKPALARAINNIIQPVRDHFINNIEAKKLLDEIKSFNIIKN